MLGYLPYFPQVGQNKGLTPDLLDAKPHTISWLFTLCSARRAQETVRPIYVELQ